jgi:RNA polymerase sigma factor (sigma-70 family)
MSAVAGRRPLHVGALSDDELVYLARSGHEPAFEAIVHRYSGPLHSYCRRWLDPHRAEEVVQHTLMKAFLCVRDDDRPLVLRPWLYRVAHNAALNALEKKGSDWEQLDENYDGVPQPPQVAEKRARFQRVVGEIGALPARQREALVLNEFEGRCYADIAAELGTSESGVRGLLRRARRQLRETAAAVLLPFPVLRELVRTDGARGFQVDRAGELIGTAGAAGGVGAAGGLAKVAAGVLAAGTIAGGGTAIEQNRDAFKTPDAEAADIAAAQRGGADQTAGVAGPGGPDGPRAPIVFTPTATGGGHVVADAGLGGGGSGGGGHGSLGGVESDAPAETEPEEAEETPILPIPIEPVGSEPEQPAEEEPPPAGEVQDGGSNDGGAKDDGTKDPDSTADGEEPAPDEQGSSNPDRPDSQLLPVISSS